LYNDYILTAFSKIDANHKAVMNINEYISFLMNFRKNIDIIHANRSIAVPLFGSGITRFSTKMPDQELLECILWTFKVSGLKIDSNASLSIVLHSSKKKKLNLLALKSLEK